MSPLSQPREPDNDSTTGTWTDIPVGETGKSEYESKVGAITVSVRTFVAQKKTGSKAEKGETGPTGEAPVLFIPGYGVQVGLKQIESLCQGMADETGAPAYAMSTWVHEAGRKGSLEQQVESMARDVRESGLTRVKLVGFSQGGKMATMLLRRLKELCPELTIEGLVLIASMGLYEQDTHVLRRLAVDTVQTSLHAIRNTVRTAIRSLNDPWRKHLPTSAGRHDYSFARNALLTGNELVAASWGARDGIAGRMSNDFDEMTEVGREDLEAVDVPVLLINGRYDFVSRADKVVPKSLLKRQKLSRAAWPPTISAPGRPSLLQARDTYLHENLFPNSPGVRMKLVGNQGTHSVSTTRGASLARIAMAGLRNLTTRIADEARQEEKSPQ